MPRPRKLEIDPSLQSAIVDAVRRGAPPERAAIAAGVSASTHYDWQAKGLAERERRAAGKAAPRKTWQVFLDYVDALERAVAQAELDLLENVRLGGEGWQASLAILERRFRDSWAPKALDGSRDPTQAAAPAPVTSLAQLQQRRAARGGKRA